MPNNQQHPPPAPGPAPPAAPPQPPQVQVTTQGVGQLAAQESPAPAPVPAPLPSPAFQQPAGVGQQAPNPSEDSFGPALQWASFIFGRSDKFGDFRLPNIALGIFQGQWDNDAILRTAAAYGRIRVLAQRLTEEYSQTLMALGEVLMVDKIDPSKVLAQVAAQAAFIGDITAVFPITGKQFLTSAAREYPTAVAAGGALAAHAALLPADITTAPQAPLTPLAAMDFLQWLTPYITDAAKGTELLVWMLCSLSKQGTTSTAFETKVVDAISAEFGVTISIPPGVVKAIWHEYGGLINETNIKVIFDRWIGFLPPNALRTRLTMEQEAAGGKLTTFITIVRAMENHPRFNWTAITQLFPAEWTNFQTAIAAVGDNRFYGYKKDLGAVRSTQYKSLGYIAKELMVKVSGEASLNRHAGFTRSTAFKATIDKMVVNYLRVGRQLGIQHYIVPAGITAYQAYDDPVVGVVVNSPFTALFGANLAN
ncbi:hypothetical protein GWK47_048102 [Chionoecetes opilio]|uniref:Uncharacterized protein n=1 Tax=Chionoecetes opilio TaxID=41210 RepID=A0A8J5CFY4_CHIOP|nr:hypothetical protein GWK47_048102 [Chionoecetes opilio]